MRAVSFSAKEAAAAFQNFAQILNLIIPKEHKVMKIKLILMEARLHTLEGRNTECERIRAKLKRQIRNLKAVMAA